MELVDGGWRHNEYWSFEDRKNIISYFLENSISRTMLISGSSRGLPIIWDIIISSGDVNIVSFDVVILSVADVTISSGCDVTSTKSSTTDISVSCSADRGDLSIVWTFGWIRVWLVWTELEVSVSRDDARFWCDRGTFACADWALLIAEIGWVEVIWLSETELENVGWLFSPVKDDLKKHSCYLFD